MSFPKYPKYKDSDVDWLGDVPEHWSVSAMKRLACLKSGDGITADNIEESGQFPVYGGNGLRGYTSKFTHDGHFVIMGRQGALCGNINYAQGKFWASEHAVVVAPLQPVSTFWLGEMLRAMNLNQYSVSAAQPGLSMEFVGNLRTVLPPLAEQAAIAEFLDRETSKIDSLVAEQRRLIELLKEKRQAVISHAVTKGLNPHAPMKPSGIPWLGDVPGHWEITPVKYLANVGNGSTPSREVPEYWTENGFPWLNSSVVNQTVVTEAEGFVSDVALRECHLPIIEPPAVLVGITGQGRTRGMAAMLGIVATINQHVAYVKPNDAILDVNFLLRAFESAYEKLRRDSEEAGATKGAITCEQIRNLRIPVPPILEQGAIVNFLDAETAKLDALTAEAERAIELLQERRTALISAAVTGKIDVRNLVEAN